MEFLKDKSQKQLNYLIEFVFLAQPTGFHCSQETGEVSICGGRSATLEEADSLRSHRSVMTRQYKLGAPWPNMML